MQIASAFFGKTKWFVTLLLVAGLAACGGGGGSGGGGGGSTTPTTGTWTFSNTSGTTVWNLYMWNSSQGTTKPTNAADQLGTSTLASGSSFNITSVPCGNTWYFQANNQAGTLIWTNTGTGASSIPCGGTLTTTLQGAATGKLTITRTAPTTTTGGNVSLSIDGVSVYTFTGYYTSTVPSCGTTPNTIALYTATVAAGSHTVSATAPSVFWPATTYNVTAGGCTAVNLQ